MDSTDEAELQRTEDELTTLKEIVQEALENRGVLGEYSGSTSSGGLFYN